MPDTKIRPFTPGSLFYFEQNVQFRVDEILSLNEQTYRFPDYLNTNCT